MCNHWMKRSCLRVFSLERCILLHLVKCEMNLKLLDMDGKKKICCRLYHIWLVVERHTHTHTHIWLVVERYTDYYYYCCTRSSMSMRVKWPCFYCPGRWNSYWRVVYAFLSLLSIDVTNQWQGTFSRNLVMEQRREK